MIVQIHYELRRALDQALRPLRLTTPQFAALAALDQEGPLSGARLARRCFVRPQTMQGIIAQLESKRFIERDIDPGNRKARPVIIARRARFALDRAYRAQDAIEKRLLDGIAKSDDELMRRTIAAMLHNIGQRRG
jgi:DNA-binding MarR family transcriptional regulator